MEQGRAQIPEKIGTKDSNSLSTVPITPKPKSKVIARLANTTTTDNIVRYIIDNLPDLSPEDVNCTTLIPANKKAEDLNHINFRVTVPDNFYDQTFNPSFWPKGVRLREYVSRSTNQLPPAFLPV